MTNAGIMFLLCSWKNKKLSRLFFTVQNYFAGIEKYTLTLVYARIYNKYLHNRVLEVLIVAYLQPKPPHQHSVWSKE